MPTLARILKASALAIAATALAAILCLVFAQVTMRFVFDRPLSWPEELSRIIFIYLVFIGAAEASVARTHIAVDMVDTFGLSSHIDRWINVLRDLAMLTVLVIIVVGAWTMIPIVHSMRLPATGLRISLMVVPVLIGGVLMSAATVLHLIADAMGHPLPRAAADSHPDT